MICFKCNKDITSDEAALTKKLINRGTEKYFCLECLSEHFKVRKEALEEKIEYLKKSGCTLFSKDIKTDM